MDRRMSNVTAIQKTNSTETISLLVTGSQARAMLGISVSHLRRLIAVGRLQPVNLSASPNRQRSGKLHFRRADILAIVEKRATR